MAHSPFFLVTGLLLFYCSICSKLVPVNHFETEKKQSRKIVFDIKKINTFIKSFTIAYFDCSGSLDSAYHTIKFNTSAQLLPSSGMYQLFSYEPEGV